MKQFTSVHDVPDLESLVAEASALKADPFQSSLGNRKTLGLVFFNASLRTRMSTHKAAANLGMSVITMNTGTDGWKIEFEDGKVMSGDTQEHIKDAVRVMSSYVDVLAVRTFANLVDPQIDYEERVLNAFIRYSSVPVISLESATLHPLQSLADLLTIREEYHLQKPKVVLSWAPHPRALPQAVANSFLQWMHAANLDITVACPEGMELHPDFMQNAQVIHNQKEAFEGADIIYTKNWSSFSSYGKIHSDDSWIINEEKMSLTNNGHFMHCLPIRRNVIATDAVIDNSLVYQQAENRVYAAQAVLQKILEAL